MHFIHTADLHLGAAPDKNKPWGVYRADAVRHSLQRLADICIRENTDLLLIAGDLFHRPPVLQELKEVDSVFASLPHTKVVLIAGNHDYIRPGSAYAEYRFAPNVSFLSSPEFTSVFFPQWNLEVHGFSYSGSEIRDPLPDLKAPADGRRHILMLHGGDDKHLPLRPAALSAGGWDYIALGHIHKPSVLAEGRMAYPGSPEPLDETETGSHGYCAGTLKDGEFVLDWRSFSLSEYNDLTVHVTPAATQASLENLIAKRSGQDYRELLSLRLVGRRDPALTIDTEAITRLGPICSVTDETLPDYPLDEWMERPASDLIARYTAAFGGASAEGTDRKALYYGLDALLASSRRNGRETMK